MVLSKNFSLLRHPLMYASGDKSPMKTTYARIALTDKNTMHSVSLMHRFNLLFKNLVFCKQALLSVVGAASILLGISSTLYAETTPRVNSGVVDLQNWNFDTGGMVPLSGDYGFFWNELLETWKQPTDYITVPASWTDTQATRGRIYAVNGYATYSLRILLPKNHAPLSIYIKNHLITAKVFANGVELIGYGNTGKSSADVKTPCFVLPQGEQQIDVLFQVKEPYARKQGLYSPISIDKAVVVEAKLIRNEIIAVMIFSFALALGLYHFILFIFRPKEKSLLYFSLLVFIVTVRILSTDTLPGCDLFGFSWALILKLEYLSCIYVSCIKSTYITLSLSFGWRKDYFTDSSFLLPILRFLRLLFMCTNSLVSYKYVIFFSSLSRYCIKKKRKHHLSQPVLRFSSLPPLLIFFRGWKLFIPLLRRFRSDWCFVY